MSSNRVFYAVQGIGFKEIGVEGVVPTGREIHGAQSVALNTTFNLEQLFELGQIEIYENYENKPDIELTVEKLMDDTPLVYHVTTAGSSGPSITARTTKQTIGVLPIYPDSYESCSGIPSTIVTCSGLYVSALNYTLPVDGSLTESVTLIGSDKVWSASTDGFQYDFNNDDAPGTAGVQRREDVIMGAAPFSCRLPTELPGISSSGTNEVNSGGTAFEAHVQTITCSIDLGREDLFELGRKNEYYKFVNFPVETTCTIDMTATDEGDSVDARSDQDNLTDQTIRICTTDNTEIYLGTKNKLSSVSYSGGDATGGNVTVSFTYTGQNTFYVTNPDNDPDGFAHQYSGI